MGRIDDDDTRHDGLEKDVWRLYGGGARHNDGSDRGGGVPAVQGRGRHGPAALGKSNPLRHSLCWGRAVDVWMVFE